MQKFLFLSVILRGDDMIKFYFLLCAFAIFLIFGCGGNDSNDFPSDPADGETILSSSDDVAFDSSSSSSVALSGGANGSLSEGVAGDNSSNVVAGSSSLEVSFSSVAESS